MFDDIFNGADALLLFALLTALFILLFPEVLVRATVRYLPGASKRRSMSTTYDAWCGYCADGAGPFDSTEASLDWAERHHAEAH